MRFLAATLCVVLGAGSALGAGPGAGDKRKQANAALLSGDTDGALALVEEGLALDPKDKELLLLRGHVLLKMSDYAAALEAYKAYLASGASGGNRRAVERIVANLNNITSTFLRVAVKNGPAQVFVDQRSGKPFCVADPECKKGIVPGDHVIIVERPGFGRATERVTIDPNTTASVEKTLVEKPSPLALKVEPADAQVTVDGAPAGKELAPGPHTLVAARDGYVRHSETVVAAGGEKLTVSIVLRRGVPIALEPAGARVEIDGEAADVAEGMVAVPPGNDGHKLRASAPGYADATADIPARPPADFRLAITLVPLGAELVVLGAPAGAAVTVDGTVRGTVPLAAPVTLPAGSHSVEVTAPGYLPFRRSADLPAGRTATVRIDEMLEPSHTARWVSFGVAGAAVASGSIFGLLALSKQSDYDDMAKRAGTTRVDPSLQSLKDDGERFSLISDVSFGVGIAAVAAGIYFWRTEGSGSSTGNIEVGPGHVAWSGSF